MQGHVYLNATHLEDEETTRIAVDCDLQDVGALDKFKLMESLCKALKISRHEWMCFVMLLDREM